MTTLSGLRLFFVLGTPSAPAAAAIERLADGLRARGAAVTHAFSDGPSASEEAALRDVVRRFAPTTLVSAWSAFGVDLAATSSLPVVHLASAAGDPPTLGPSPRGIVLWLDENADDAAAPPVCPVPSITLGSLEGDGREGAIDLFAELLVETRAVHRRFPPIRSPEGPLAIGRDELVDYVHTSSPDGLHTRDEVEALVDQGMALGMPWWGEEPRPIFDRSRSIEWLFRRSAAFRAEVAAHRRTREQGGITAEAPRPDPAVTRTCRVSASVSADLADLEPGTRVRIYLPYPVEAPLQPSVELVSVRPASIADSLVAGQGFFFGWEGCVTPEQELTAGFVADVRVREAAFDVPESICRAAPAARSFVEVRERASQLGADTLARAWSVYAWMMHVGRFGRPALGCRCGDCAAAHFQRETSGDCIVLSHAFVHFCGQLGVRARPVRGALFGAPRGSSGRRFGVAKPGEPIIGHTWAEFEAPGRGWVPVEFDPICLKNIEPALCWDASLRERLRGDHEYLLQRSFGRIDHQRIVYSSSVIDIPPILYFDNSLPRGQRWRPLDLSRLRFDHEVEYR